jgi:hypothetical protein
MIKPDDSASPYGKLRLQACTALEAKLKENAFTFCFKVIKQSDLSLSMTKSTPLLLKKSYCAKPRSAMVHPEYME